MATIQIDKTEYPDLQDCKVGEPLALTGKVTAIDGDMLTIDVDNATYDDNAEPGEGGAGEEASAGEESDMAPAKMMSKGPPRAIVAIGIPGGKKGY